MVHDFTNVNLVIVNCVAVNCVTLLFAVLLDFSRVVLTCRLSYVNLHIFLYPTEHFTWFQLDPTLISIDI